MRKLIVILLFFPLFASAAEYSLLTLIGLESRYELDQDQNYMDRRLSNYALGFGRDNLFLLAEYGRFDVGSGNQSLTVNRKFENYLAWLMYVEPANRLVKYFLSAGAGYYKQSADTIFLGQKTTDESNLKPMGGGSVGIVFQPRYFWTSVEARVLFIEGLEPNPTVSAVGRIGLHFF